ncbi:MAG: hypothetical protein KA275_02075 [Chitinophagaceae bacterium]|nr:hypothetical protein [Chitinophagaceae bacterium]
MTKDLINLAISNLVQLKKVLSHSTTLHYTSRLQILFESTIGMHVRHIIEFYQCLADNNSTGIISYDDRIRNSQFENDLEFTISYLDILIEKISSIENNENLILLNDNTFTGNKLEIKTNTNRELTYLIEHTIHHLAIIKMAYTSNFQEIIFDDDFGVAFSTIKYKNSVHRKLSAS